MASPESRLSNRREPAHSRRIDCRTVPAGAPQTHSRVAARAVQGRRRIDKIRRGKFTDIRDPSLSTKRGDAAHRCRFVTASFCFCIVFFLSSNHEVCEITNFVHAYSCRDNIESRTGLRSSRLFEGRNGSGLC